MSKPATGATGKRMTYAFPEIPWHKNRKKKSKHPATEALEPEEGETDE